MGQGRGLAGWRAGGKRISLFCLGELFFAYASKKRCFGGAGRRDGRGSPEGRAAGRRVGPGVLAGWGVLARRAGAAGGAVGHRAGPAGADRDRGHRGDRRERVRAGVVRADRRTGRAVQHRPDLVPLRQPDRADGAGRAPGHRGDHRVHGRPDGRSHRGRGRAAALHRRQRGLCGDPPGRDESAAGDLPGRRVRLRRRPGPGGQVTGGTDPAGRAGQRGVPGVRRDRDGHDDPAGRGRTAVPAGRRPGLRHRDLRRGGHHRVRAGHQGRAVSRPGSETAATGSAPATAPPSPPVSLRRQLALLVLDIGAPIGLYYGLRAAGMSNLVALGAGAIVPAVGVIVQLVTRRSLAGCLTAMGGLWFLSTLRARWARRPAAFALARPLMEGRRAFGSASWDQLWADEPGFRRIWRVSTIVWGVGLLADAGLRVLMSYTLPIAVVPALAGALWPATFILIQLVTNVYYHRAGLYRLLGAPWADEP